MSNSSQTTLTVTRLAGEPAAMLGRWLEDAPAEAILLVDFELQQWWLGRQRGPAIAGDLLSQR